MWPFTKKLIVKVESCDFNMHTLKEFQDCQMERVAYKALLTLAYCAAFVPGAPLKYMQREFTRETLKAEIRKVMEWGPEPTTPAPPTKEEKLRVALTEVYSCFEAAYCEGLQERLAEQDNQEPGDLFGLVIRRLLPAYEVAQRALQEE